MQDFREFLRGWMREHRETTLSLEDKTGISNSTIGRWLSEKHRAKAPTDESLKKLSPVVGKSYNDLMRMTGRLEASPDGEEEDENEILIRDIVAMLKAQPERDELKNVRDYVEFRNQRRLISFVKHNANRVGQELVLV